MEKIGRIRRSQSDWQELIERQKRSGLKVAEFCRQEGVTAASLYVWRSRLGGAKQTQLTKTPARKSDVETEDSVGFIDLGSLGTHRSRFEVRLDLGHGVLLHLVRN